MDDQFVTPMGTMRIVEMLLYYDGPKLFVCHHDPLGFFMAHLVEEQDDGDRWFLVPMSLGRLEHVRTGRISLRESVQAVEGGHIYDTFCPVDGQGLLSIRSVATLDESELPGMRGRLERPAHGLPTLDLDVQSEANQAMRDVLRFSLDNGRHDQVVDADYYGAFILRTQNFVRHLGDRREASRGPIPKAIADLHALMFTGSFAASVGIRLESKFHTDLLDTPTRPALEAFMELLEAGDSKERLQIAMKDIPKRAVSRYRFLLDVLDRGALSLSAQWGSPGRPHKQAVLTDKQARAVIGLLDEDGDDLMELITLSGDLVGVVKAKNGRKARFELVTEDGIRYRGSIAPDLVIHAFQVTTFGATVVLEATTEINPATSEEHVSYVLVGFNGIGLSPSEKD